MTAFSIKNEYAIEFLKSIGIDHTKVKYIKLEMGVDLATMITVEYFMEGDSLDELNNLNKRYILSVSKVVEKK